MQESIELRPSLIPIIASPAAEATLPTDEQSDAPGYRIELIDRVLKNLIADAERGEGELRRADIDRVYMRRNLTVPECGWVEAKLQSSDVRIVDDEEEDEELETNAVAGDAATRRKKRYLTDIEERELGRKIQLAKRAMEEAGQATSEFLLRCIADAERAKARFVESNIRYVYQLVRQRRYLKHLAQEDLAQEGMMGLLRAADLYDPELGFRFKTYATWWIQQHIGRAIDDDERTVRLPVHVHESLRKIKRKRRKLASELGREPTLSELADHLGLEKERLSKLLWKVQVTDCSEGDAPIVEEGATHLSLKSDDEAISAFEIVAQQQLRTRFRTVLASLSPREERVIRMRFGMDGSSELTLEAVGQQFGVTRERIRQIEAKALRRLKHPSRSRDLRSFLD